MFLVPALRVFPCVFCGILAGVSLVNGATVPVATVKFSESFTEKVVCVTSSVITNCSKVSANRFTVSGKIPLSGETQAFTSNSIFIVNLGGLRLTNALGADPSFKPGKRSAQLRFTNSTGICVARVNWDARQVRFSISSKASGYGVAAKYLVARPSGSLNEMFEGEVSLDAVKHAFANLQVTGRTRSSELRAKDQRGYSLSKIAIRGALAARSVPLAGQPVYGRVVSAVVMSVPGPVLSELRQSQAARIAKLGLKFVDEGLALPEVGMPGQLVRVGDRSALTDSSGVFRLDGYSPGTDGAVFNQLSDTNPMVTFTTAYLSSVPRNIPTIRVVSWHGGPVGMDGDEPEESGVIVAAGEPICGNCEGVGNSDPCCLDYNGPFGTGCKVGRSDLVRPVRILNYIQSTCYKLVEAGVCMREFNSHVIDERVPGLNCYKNHKYRNCQSLGLDDFRVSPTNALIAEGGTAVFRIRNNTPANETRIGIDRNPAGGELEGTESADGVTLVRHYSDISESHLEEVEVTFTGGTIPPGEAAVTNVYFAAAYTSVQRFKVAVARVPVLISTGFSGGVVSLGFSIPMDDDYSISWQANAYIPSTAFKGFRWSSDKRTLSFNARIPPDVTVEFVLNSSQFENPDGFKSVAGIPLPRDTVSAPISN